MNNTVTVYAALTILTASNSNSHADINANTYSTIFADMFRLVKLKG